MVHNWQFTLLWFLETDYSIVFSWFLNILNKHSTVSHKALSLMVTNNENHAAVEEEVGGKWEIMN